MSYDLYSEHSHVVTTGDSFRIFHRISEGYLSVNENYEIVVEKGRHNANSLWELQRLATFVGGTAL